MSGRTNIYAAWRRQRVDEMALHEGGEGHPPERLLQVVWFHQRLRRDRLQTLDGRPVRVLHPGFWNREAGPDFRHALVQIGEEPPRVGDIEIDLFPSNWRGHGHDKNPNFAQVLLHVCWTAEAAGASAIPTLALKPVLDAPLDELLLWLDTDAAQSWPEALQGDCCLALKDLPADTTLDLMRQAAFVRFQRKANDLQARARQAGWEQALWEGLFRALGYKNNVWPMVRLAEMLPQMTPDKVSPLAWQARLLGCAGLLPTERPAKSATSSDYVRRLWDIWWRDREAFADLALPVKLWRFHGMRPANHPMRRLALASHWLSGRAFPGKLEQWLVAAPPKGQLAPSLRKLLEAEADPYWSWHWTLNAARLASPQPLLGQGRATDLAVNVILPWLWVRASLGRNAALVQTAEQRFFDWPAAEDNAVLRLARQRLLGGKVRCRLSAAVQQGVLQITRDFCDQTNAACARCRFPDLVRQWQGGSR